MISAYSLSSIFINVCYYNHYLYSSFLDSYSTMCLASLSFSLYCLLTFKVTYFFSTSSKLGKEYIKVVYCNLAYLNYTQSTSCQMLAE